MIKKVVTVTLGMIVAFSLPPIANAGLPGDINGDGVVSISEVQEVINAFLGISKVPQGPVANAGADKKVEMNSIVELDGRGSTGNNNVLTYLWTITSKPVGSAAALSSATSSLPTFTPDISGIYTINLVVNDGVISSATDTVLVTAGVRVPDYDRMVNTTSCTATYLWTYGAQNTKFSEISSGSETVPYTTGPLTGRITVGGREDASITTFNDGASYKLIRYNDDYISHDCALTNFSPDWSFDLVYNNLLLNQGQASLVSKTNQALCVPPKNPSDQKLLFTVQDVTVQEVLYKNAIIWWYIDTKVPYHPLDAPALAALGVHFPTSAETGGFAITDIDIWGYGKGLIAGGDIQAVTGVLNDLAELDSLNCQ